MLFAVLLGGHDWNLFESSEVMSQLAICQRNRLNRANTVRSLMFLFQLALTSPMTPRFVCTFPSPFRLYLLCIFKTTHTTVAWSNN